MSTLTERLTALLETAETELAAMGNPAANSFIQPGQQVAWDDCCGRLYVRVVTVHPVNPLPTKVFDTVPCQYPLGAQIALGVLRCQTGLTDDSFPTDADLTADGTLMIEDMAALYRAIVCEEGMIVDRWSPLGPQGGCFGGEWYAWVGDFSLPEAEV